MRMTIARGKHSRKSQSRTKFGSLVVMAIVLGLAISSIGIAFAKGGPHDRATGTIEFDIGADRQRAATFDAHEGKDGREAKGSFAWLDWVDGEYIIGIEVDVQCVSVDGDEAWFAGPVTYTRSGVHTSWPGRWMGVYVKDAGDPGTEGPDQLVVANLADEAAACDWVTSNPSVSNDYVMNGGNLKVHSSE